MRSWICGVPLLVLLGTPAWAGGGKDDDDQDDSGKLDDLLGDDDDDDDDEAPAPPPTGGDLDDEPGGDILDEPIDAPTSSDSAATYRSMQERVKELEPDEEVEAWQRYLDKYPDTTFRSRIEQRMDDLMTALYGEHIDDGETGTPTDARTEEIHFAQGLLIENINPRTRFVAGFEFGLPSYLGLYASYEQQLDRRFSVGGGFRTRYTGWNAEAGVKYALIKAERTQTLLTLIGDVHFNFNPAFVGLRPQVAFGKIFGDVLHVQAQTGIDFEVRRFPGVHWIGGANVTWMASRNVAVFGETQFDAKNLTWADGGTFRFNTATVGLKFLPTAKNMDPDSLELNIGASVPYATQYWDYHFGSVMAQVNYYPKPRAASGR